MSVHSHSRAVGKFENVGSIFNFNPMSQMANISPVIRVVVKIASRIRGYFVFMSEYVYCKHYLLDISKSKSPSVLYMR